MSKENITIDELIRSAKADHSKKVDFNTSNETIDFIPDLLFELTDIEELNLGYNLELVRFLMK